MFLAISCYPLLTFFQDRIINSIGSFAIAHIASFCCSIQRLAPSPEFFGRFIRIFTAGSPSSSLRPPMVHFLPKVPNQLLYGMVMVTMMLMKISHFRRTPIQAIRLFPWRSGVPKVPVGSRRNSIGIKVIP